MQYNNEYENMETLSFESPFADTLATTVHEEPVAMEYEDHESFSPFEGTALNTTHVVSNPKNGAVAELMGELESQEFNEVLYNMAGELMEMNEAESLSQFEFGKSRINIRQQAYVTKLADAGNNLIDKINERVAVTNVPSLSEAEIDQLFEQFTHESGDYTPVQEQFLGKIIKTVKKAVKGGVNLVKKGIKAVSKVLPINKILEKIKSLIKPLLERVLRFAIGKLPQNLQPHARTLAKKMLNIDAETAFEAEYEADANVSAIQNEFNEQVAGVVFSEAEYEADRLTAGYAQIADSNETPDLNEARKKFVEELKQLKPGESPQPAIENFLPAALMALQPAVKIAISIIGRDKVIGFLAKPLAGLVKKYIPMEVALPLATKIVDIGLGAIGFETNEQNQPDTAYEAIANTIEETISGMDMTRLADEATMENLYEAQQTLPPAFEQAAANNFPNSLIKSELHTSSQNGVWVLMPRNSNGNYSYKKFSKVFDVTLDAGKVRNIKTFRNLPLSNFLRDKFGITLSQPVHVRVHVYEAIKGTWLSKISKYEQVPGLNTASQSGWNQIHPLSTVAAAALLSEPGLGRNFSSKFTNSRHMIGVGQRFYYLEINKPVIRRPQKPNPGNNNPPSTPQQPGAPARSSDIQCVLNFVRSEIRLNYFFSEAEAISVASKLRNNDYIGAAASIQYSIRTVLHNILLKNATSKVKIIHESMPEMYMENFLPAALGAAARAVGGAVAAKGAEMAADILKKVVEKIVMAITDAAIKAVANYYKTRASEFIAAQADPKDGVTVKIIFFSVPGMSTISAVIQAVKGNLSVGNIADLVFPGLPIPEVQVKADKHFD